MTNKKLKMAAMSVALTACVAASPLAANADAPEAAPGEPKKEPVAEETKKEENTAEPQVNQEAKNAQETLKDAEVKYNKNPTTNPDGSQKLDGVIVTNPEGSGETGSGETGSGETGSGETGSGETGSGETGSGETGSGETGSGETGSGETGSGETGSGETGSGETGSGETGSGETGSGETGSETGGETGSETGGETNPNPNPGSGETKPEQKKPEEVVIGTAEKTEKSETNVETKPNPGAEPIKDNTPPTVEKKPDGSTAITESTVTPGKEITTTTGSGEAKGNLHEKKEEVKKEDINLDKELGEKPDISWDIKKGADAVNGYKVEDVTNSEDGNKQTLKLRKEEETTAEMTAEDIAKLVDAEKPTVNPDGTYTLTRTETIPDAEGNPQTRTTYITIQGSKVTTKTTTELTITRQKEERDGGAEVENKGVKYPSIKVTNEKNPEDTQTISSELLETILRGTPKDDGSYEYTDSNGQKYEVRVDETVDKLTTNAEIVARLKQDGYTEYDYDVADGAIYYTTPHKEKVKLDVTQNELLRRSLTYKVTLTTTEKGDPGTAGEEIATEKAKKNAIRSALTKAVDKLGIEDETTAAQLKAKISDLKFTQEQLDKGDTFTAEIGGKTYTLTYSAAGATVTLSTPTEDKTDTGKNPEDITDVKDNTVKGTAYVTGSKITYLDSGKYETTGMGTLGIGENFTTVPEGATEVKWDNSGRITSYKDKDGNTHSFTYKDVELNDLDDAEKAALNDAAKRGDWNPEILTASLTRVSWKVESPRIETPQTTPIENGETVNLVNDNNWSQTDHGDTVDFTHSGTTYTGMTLENESGNVKTYKKTEANGTVTIITVTTRQLGEEEIKAKFGNNFISLNLDDKTVTYKGEDGKTYTASYVAQEEKLTVEVQKPDVVAATGSTEKEARDAFLENLEKARQEAMAKGETLVIEYTKDGKIKNLVVDRKMTWDEVVVVVGHVVNYNAMTDAELVEYLNALETTAKKDGKFYDGSASLLGTTPYYWDANNQMMKRVPKGAEIYTYWYAPLNDYVKIDGKEHKVHYGNNNIDHLDLATDSKLTLSEKDKNGKAQIDDCVLLNPTLTWHEKADQLVAGEGEQAKLLNRITYDNEADDNDDTGHYEYARASWFTKDWWNDNAPTKSVFYKVEGQVAYGKLGNDYISEEQARADLQAYQDAHTGLDLSKAQVVKVYKNQNLNSPYYYQIYLYQSDLTAYGYMSDDNNTCGNALFAPGSKHDYIGGYDLTLGNLTQTDKKHVVAMGKNTIALSATIKRRKLVENLTNRELRYTPISKEWIDVTPSEEIDHGEDLSGSYRANYTKTEDYRDEQQQGGIAGTGTGSYKSFTNLIRHIFKGDGTGTEEGGFIKYVYHSEKNPDGTPVKFEAEQMVVTTKQDAEVHYTFTSQESRDVWIKGYTQTVVPPVNPGPDSPELPPVEDAKPAPAPAPAPEAPVLPVVQDARPDPAPAPAPAPAPETPVLPAVQDAKLIQTGTSGWLADLMLGAGMVLSAAGYWMERKRKAMFYKSQH